VRDTHDAGRAVDRRAEVIVIAVLDDARMQAAPNTQRKSRRFLYIFEPPRQLDDRHHGVQRIAENRVDTIAGRLDERTLPRFDGGARERIMAGERVAHALGLLVPQPGAALDVGEQERRDRGLLLHQSPRIWPLRYYFTAGVARPPARYDRVRVRP
jgi:hypothetical protein